MKILLAALGLTCAVHVSAQTEVLQVFSAEEKTYNPVEWEDIKKVNFDAGNDLMKIRTIENKTIAVPLKDGLRFASGATPPLINITTDVPVEEITSKKDYLTGQFEMKCFGNYTNEKKAVSIRGRGNSSWAFPKKPYRIKFDKKVSLCGLPSAKNYVLLASWTDHSLMQFALATKIGQMLELPYTNQVVPVEVNLNGIYRGAYILTNKPGMNSGSVDIDESESILWELDTNYDEDYKFKSPLLKLPVMVSDPDMDDATFQKWKADFIAMERAVVNGHADEWIDLDIFARYLLVYSVLKNDEIGFPKSVKLFKTNGGKYIFGPIWDFDSAMGYVWLEDQYTTAEIENQVWMNSLFKLLYNMPEVKKAYRRHRQALFARMDEIKSYLEQYAEDIRTSASRNRAIWPDFNDWEESVEDFHNWLDLRVEAMIENDL